MQHIINFNEGNTLEQVKELFALYNIDSFDITKKENEKKSKWDLDLEPTAGWNSIKWLKYLISKEFWIDSYVNFNSVYAGSQHVVIIHHKPF